MKKIRPLSRVKNVTGEGNGVRRRVDDDFSGRAGNFGYTDDDFSGRAGGFDESPQRSLVEVGKIGKSKIPIPPKKNRRKG